MRLHLRPGRLHDAAELLDGPVEDAALYEESLGHVAAVNRWLGGVRSLTARLDRLLPLGPTALLDLGTGSADVPLRIARWAAQRGRDLHIVASDIHPAALELARRRTAGVSSIRIAGVDARALPFADGAFDVTILVLAFHHFGDDDQTRVLTEMARVSRRAILVSELARTWPNYLGARLLAATLWRRNAITRHDGPISVLRGFTPAELRAAAARAGLPRARTARHFYERLLLEASPPGPGSPPA